MDNVKKDAQIRAYEKAPSSYKLDKRTYKVVQYIVRSYPLYKAESRGEVNQRIYDEYKSNVERQVILRNKNRSRMLAIEKAFMELPVEYRQMIFDHVVYQKQYKYIDEAHEQTLKKYTHIFMYFAAYYLDEI